MLDHDEIVSHAQELLTRRFGGAQRLTDVQQLRGSGNAIVLRAKVPAQPFLTERTVVIKHIPESEDALDVAALIREIAAYQFTTAMADETRPGPYLLAQDVEKRLIVLSDVGDHSTLSELLESEGEASRRVHLRHLGLALGRMHAATAGKEKGFNSLLARMIKSHPEAAQSHDVRDRSLGPAIALGLQLISDAGVDVPVEVKSLVADAVARLKSTRFLAFTPFDLSPDNVVVSERMDFLDYEWAGFRDVAFDLACVIGGFPQYVGGARIDDEDVQVFLRAWTNETQHVWPRAVDEEHLHASVLTALVGWAMSCVAMMHYGSLATALVASQQSTSEDVEFDGEVSVKPRLLEPAKGSAFNREETFIRQDIYETFEALERFASHGGEPEHAVVAEFARQVAARVHTPHR
ncbi:phosphotransferase family protein [Corynebacterium tapiri]|uniref:Phosphotransferase n=1 Tax=Corynebacterium tapiri TaxID=1448266 RepID=A0A5C4U418_9CORY|nr:phosphotransferase [Corynebacterium tapiri]TNL97765.1 phosphotransferase [Corynebacterium tapiri]